MSDHNWNGRKVLHPDHAHRLDSRAAVYELHHRMPREAAEDRSYQDYMRQMAVDSAGHHLAGVRVANFSNNLEAAKQHGAAYSEAIRLLGLSPADHPPPEVEEAAKKALVYKFSAHKHDGLFEKDEPEVEDVKPVAERLLAAIQQAKANIKKAMSR